MKVTTVTFLLLLMSITSHSRVKRNLYGADHNNINILNGDNFENAIENSTKAWLVEFYAYWCGYCIKFAPKWKKLTMELTSWQDLVSFAAVDCSEERNLAICRKHGVVKFPTILYFHENWSSFYDNNVIKLQGDYSTETHNLKNNIIKILIEEQQKGRGKQYPNLELVSANKLQDLFETASMQEINFVFLVINREENYFGNELALDLHNTANIIIRQTQSSDQHNQSLIVYNIKNNETTIYEDIFNYKAQIRKIIESYVDLKNVSFKDNVVSLGNATVQLIDNNSPRYFVESVGDIVYQRDLETALLYSLQREVATHTNITGKALQALYDYLVLVQKYLYLDSVNKKLIDDLLSIISSVDEITGDSINKILKQAASLSAPLRYFGCQGSSERYRGYPCTLWQLFHFFTVNAAINKENYTVNSQEVLHVMQGYVKHFFSCQHCSEHFQEMVTERKMSEVLTMDDAVLWLWDVHNAVNSRLKGDITEDPKFPKYQFPTKTNCEKCYQNDNSWNLVEVFNYLVWMYDEAHVKHFAKNKRDI